MIKKIYPHAIMIKRSLVGIAVVIVSLLVILIVHNVYASSHEANANQNSSKTIQTTDQNAKSWYENEVISKQVATPAPQLANSPVIQPGQRTAYIPNRSKAASSVDQKAMSASIVSNQLTDTQTNLSSNNMGNLSANTASAAGANPNDSNPNQQGEKIGFMQSNNQAADSDYLGAVLKKPITPYELQAGTIIPGILITGINSDLPGQITGQVRSTVYDSISGKYVLIPQGAKITGLYDSQVTYGQARVLVAWQRIIFPDGQSIDLQGMPGADMSGYSGFKDQVNNHYAKIFGSVILMSVISAGAQLSQPQNNNNVFTAPSVGQVMAQSLGNNLSNTATMITSKNINIQPTLQIRPGYEFNIAVTKDMVFPGAYQE